MNRVVVIDTGISNTASVQTSFERLGCLVTISHDVDLVREAPYVVLPGVGSFGAGMDSLRRWGLDRIIVERIDQDMPLLGICLGLQLLCVGSEESPEVNGLGVIDSMVTEFPSSVRTPQHGWNNVGDGFAYFSNTYRIEKIPDGWVGVMSDHGGPFVASLQRRTTLACQFHPELSGGFGEQILAAWLASSKEAFSC